MLALGALVEPRRREGDRYLEQSDVVDQVLQVLNAFLRSAPPHDDLIVPLALLARKLRKVPIDVVEVRVW